MSEQIDKASQKTRKAPATKRPPKKARPAGKRSSAAKRKTSAKGEAPAPKPSGKSNARRTRKQETNGSAASKKPQSLAPDPATITFGSNRPIVAAPPPKPESSGLRFAGPSDGVLKSSGPQPTSPKAEGLTFSNAKPESGLSAASAKTGEQSPQNTSPAEKTSRAPKTSQTQIPTAPQKSSTAKSAGKAAEAPKQRDSKQPGKAEIRKAKTEPGKTKAETAKAKTTTKPSGSTKPAIAPQNHGPLIEKEPSRGPLSLALGGLGIVAIGLVWWLNSQNTPAPAPANSELAAKQTPDNAETPAARQQQAALAPSKPAGEPTPSPDSVPAATESELAPPSAAASSSPTAAPTTGASLSVAEVREVQDLLQKLGLDVGAGDGEMTEATRAAIRDYQTMAGLPVDGEASPALLEELRSVALLYGGN